MTNLLSALCLCLLFVTFETSAQNPQTPKKATKQVPIAATAVAPKAVWISEPSAFLGVTLGIQLKDQASMPKCAKPGQVEPFCYWLNSVTGPNPEYLDTWNAPKLVSGSGGVRVTLVLSDGEVHGVMLTLPHYSSEEFVELLKTKYGDPHDVSLNTYQNSGGATFEGKVYEWQGSMVSMSFSEYGSKVSEAEFQIFTTRYSAIKAAKRKANAEKVIDKL